MMDPTSGLGAGAASRRRRWRAVTLVALAFSLAACTSSGDAGADDDDGGDGEDTAQADDTTATTQPPETTEPEPTTTTVPPTTALGPTGEELTFGEYQQAMLEADQAVHTSLQNLSGVGSYGGLQGQSRQTAQTVQDAATQVEQITPPQSFSGQHEAVASSLSSFASGMTDLANRVDSQALCAAPAVVAEVNALPATGEIRAATHAFDAAGGGRLTFLPDLNAPAATRPGNGEHLRPQETSGEGELIVENLGTEGDVVVALERGGSAVLAVYVHANSTTTVTNIGDGEYGVYYSNGLEWSPALRAFARDCSFGRYVETFPYETTATQYTIWTVSLRRSAVGNAPTSPVSPDDFPS